LNAQEALAITAILLSLYTDPCGIKKSCSYLGSLSDVTINRNSYINCLNGQGAEPRKAIFLPFCIDPGGSKKAVLAYVPWVM
jgi:hypothetical protein